MAARFAWLLNLDADLELASLASGASNEHGGYTPKRGVLEAPSSRSAPASRGRICRVSG
jgi:hypothetical protein